MPVRAPDEGPSSGGSPASAVVSQSVNEDEEIEESHNPKLLRAVARKYKIESTKSLVAAYNQTMDREERAVLLGWLKKYDERRLECLKPKVVLEYVELAKIDPRSAQEKGILKNLVAALHSCLCEGKFLDKHSEIALYRALMHVDPSVYGGVGQLVIMAKKLLGSLSPEPTLSRMNFWEYEVTFVCIHQTFLLLNKTKWNGIYETQKREFRRTIIEKEKAMELSRKYYPVTFYFKVLRQAVEHLELEDAPSYLTQAKRWVIRGLYEFIHVFFVVCNLARCDIDPEAVKGAYKRHRSAFTIMGASKKPWFDPFQNLMASMLKAAIDEKKIELFHSDYDTTLEHQRKMKTGEDSKALRFGIIRQLSMLATEGESENTCKEATKKLVDLATTREASREGWTNDVDILIALLDSIHKLHSIGKFSERTKEGLQVLHQLGGSLAQEAVAEWLDGESMENMLRVRRRRRIEAEHKDLCIEFGRDVGFVQPATIESNKEDLKRTYLHDKFATVASLFEDESRKHVKNMKHHVVIYEEIIEKRQTESRDGTQGVIRGVEQEEDQNRTKDQMRECYNKKTRVTTPIALDDLFNRRSLNPGDSESEIRRVLLYGDPGSGKTCITKVIAHKWALREMAQAFDAVYVVPVRVLNNAETKRPQWTRLEEAISRICFSQRESISDHKDLICQVDDDLDESSTLLIIDGLDEANDYANDLLSTVWNRSCKILFLSRPYNMKNTEKRVDIKVECLGFNDRQLRDYIHTELSEDEAPRFINSLRDSVAMWEMAHIPVTAHILCSLSKEHCIVHEEGKRRASTFQVYKDMTNYIWKRFEEKPVARNVKKTRVFKDLEKIAFETLRKGQILIHERFVMRHATSKNAAKTIKESGLLLLVLEGQDYQFPHLTFQEYFTGVYIAKALRSEKSNAGKEVRDFINKEKYNQKYEVTLSFAMHAFAEGQASEALREMLSIVDTQPVEVLGVQHSLLRMRVLEAALGEADEENLKTIKKDKNALELAEGAHKLVSAGKNNIPMRRIVDEKLNKCPRVLEEFTQILNDRVKEVKDLLVSTEKLAESDLDEVGGSLMLARHVPKRINEIVEFVLHNMNVERQQSRSLEAIAKLENIATEAPDVSREVLAIAMLEKECVNKDAYLRQHKTRAIARVLIEMPEIVVDVLSVLNDNSDTVREESTKAIARVITVAPEIAKEALPSLKRGLTDHWRNVREESTKAISKVIEAAPEIAGELLPILERLFDDTDSAVRLEATKAIVRAIEVAPSLAGNLLPILERLCDDVNFAVRLEATKAIVRVIELVPDIAYKLLPILERLCENEYSPVREEATKAISRVIEVTPEVAGELLPVLERLCENKYFSVREEATKSIARVIKVAPDLVGKLLSILERLCENKHSFVREEATKAIVRVIKVAPSLAGNLPPIFVRLCDDTSSAVRKETTKAIARVIEVAPEIAGELLPILKRLCDDKDSAVQEESTKAIARLIEVEPTFADTLLPTLERLCQNTDSSAREEATKVIARVIELPPKIARKVIPSLERLLDDTVPAVRMEATKAYAKVVDADPPSAACMLPVFERLCDDADSAVRMEATKSIARVINVAPDVAITTLQTFGDLLDNTLNRYLIDARKTIVNVVEGTSPFPSNLLPTLERLCQNKDSAVREEATKSITRVIEVTPEISNNLLSILKKLCDSRSFSVRAGAMKSIIRVIKLTPDIVDKLLPILKRLCENTDSSVRKEATKAIAMVIELAPDIASKLMPILERLCENKHSSVREEATKAIAMVIELPPEIAFKLLPIPQRLCQNRDSAVREEATKSIARVIEVAPMLAGKLLPILERLLENEYSSVREEATKSIARVIEVAPMLAGKLLPILERLLENEYSSVREEATKSIARVIEVVPMLAGKLLPILERLLENEYSSVREEATKSITRVIEVAPDIAGNLLPILERLCDDTDSAVRMETTKAIARVIEVAPSLAGNLLPFLERLCDDAVFSVREEEMKVIVRVIEVAPSLANKLPPIFERLCQNTESAVRIEATKAIAKVINVAPSLAGNLLPILERLCDDVGFSVREESTKAIVRVIEVAPEIARKLRPILERLCQNTDSAVRMEATKSIERITEEAPDIASKMLPILERLCGDTVSAVREVAVEAIEKIIEVAPDIASNMLPILERLCQNTNSIDREMAVKAIERIIEVAPEIASNMLPILERLSGDTDFAMRRVAVNAIERIIEVAPETARELLPIFEKLCDDTDSAVRMETTKTIPRLIEVSPTLAGELLPTFEKACSDEASFVREESTKAIARVVAVAPEIAAELLPTLEKACGDEAYSVRMEATKTLDSIEVHKISSSGSAFLSSYKTGFWLFFAQNPFTISSCSTPGNVSLVLHKISSHEVVEWEKHVSLRHLQHLIQEFEKRFPGLLQQIRLKE